MNNKKIAVLPKSLHEKCGEDKLLRIFSSYISRSRLTAITAIPAIKP